MIATIQRGKHRYPRLIRARDVVPSLATAWPAGTPHNVIRMLDGHLLAENQNYSIVKDNQGNVDATLPPNVNADAIGITHDQPLPPPSER